MTPSAFTPASRLFAWELASASPILGDKNQCRTPFGIHAKEISYIGTLTEIITSGNTITALRMSDPTGVCTVNLDPRAEGLDEQAALLEVPSFVYAFGTIRTRSSKSKGEAEMSATVLKPVSRDARNTWILQTARDTALRLERMEKTADVIEFQNIIRSALETLHPAAKPSALSDEDVLDLIHSLYEGRSAPRDTVIAALKEKGLSQTQAVETIARLMEEGECYAPKLDVIKLA